MTTEQRFHAPAQAASGTMRAAHAATAHGVGGVSPLPEQVVKHVAAAGPLESWTLAAVLLLAGVVTLAWLIVSARHRRARSPRPRWATASTATAGTALVIAGLLAVLNSYVEYLPSLSSLQTAGRHGTAVLASAKWRSNVVVVRLGDRHLQVPTHDAYVYLPPGYDDPANARRRYPVVYLIHGWPGSASDWFRAGQAPRTMDTLIGHGLAKPMILVAPDVNGGWMHDSECLNAVGGPQIETFLTEVVVGFVDTHFRTITSRQGRAIGGMSSGGYCALNVGLRHLHEFSTILAHEPYGTPGLDRKDALLGGSMQRYLENSPISYIPTMAFAEPVAVFLDAPGLDPISEHRATTMAKQLAARGQAVVYRLVPNAHHAWGEARVELAYSLVFASRQLVGAKGLVESRVTQA